MTPKECQAQIQKVVTRLISTGLSNQQRYAVLKTQGDQSEIGIEGTPALSISQKDIPYPDIYRQLDEGQCYHVRMIDGALIQMLYRFKKNTVVEHRLCIFPSPHLELYDEDPESYQKDELYADIVGKSIVHVPFRFDFAADDKLHKEVEHPKSHMTVGQYPNCRIPFSAPLTPARFAKFILRNFYSTAFKAGKLDSIDCSVKFADTISTKERGVTHIMC